MLPWQTLRVSPLEPTHHQSPVKMALRFAMGDMMKIPPSLSLRPSREVEEEIRHSPFLIEMQKFSLLRTVERGALKFQPRVPSRYVEKIEDTS